MADRISTRFREQYKKSGTLSCSDAGRFTRAQNKLKERRMSRVEEFSKQRNLIEVPNENAITDSTAGKRKLKLQKWKQEKQQKMMMQKKIEKPVFKVSVVHHRMGSPYLNDISNLNHTKINKKGSTSSLKDKIVKNIPVSLINKGSLAPANFKFKAPVIKTSVIQPKENRSKSEVHNKVKVDSKPNQVDKHQPALSRRVTRSQTKSAQSKEPSQDTKLVTTRTRGRANKLKTFSQTKAPVSSLETVAEDQANDNSRKNKFMDGTKDMVSSTIENTVSSGADACMDIAENLIALSIVQDGTDAHVTENCGSNRLEDNTVPSEISENMAPVENITPNNATDIALLSTSNQPIEDQFPINYSPYVNTERGSSKRKSSRKFPAGSPIPFVLDVEREKHSVFYFRSVLKSETERLESLCETWENIKRTMPDLPQDTSGMISAAIGKTRLLLSKKFSHFHELIDFCEKGPTCEGEPQITCTDLDGFWDMVYLEVEKVDCSFNKLEKMKCDNWIEEIVSVNIPSRTNGTKRKGKKVQKPAASSSLRALIAAARKKQKSEGNNSNESSKIISTLTPLGIPEICRTPLSAHHSRQSLLQQAIMGQRRQSRGINRDSSPVIIKVTQMAKRYSNATPSISTPSQVSSEFDCSEVQIMDKSITNEVPRSILKSGTIAAQGQVSKDISFVDIQETDTITKENDAESKPSRKSSRKVRFEGAGHESPKIVQPMTPYVSRRSSLRRRSDRLSLLGNTHTESPIPVSVADDLICFDSPVPEPKRVTRRSARLSLH